MVISEKCFRNRFSDLAEMPPVRITRLFLLWANTSDYHMCYGVDRKGEIEGTNFRSPGVSKSLAFIFNIQKE